MMLRRMNCSSVYVLSVKNLNALITVWVFVKGLSINNAVKKFKKKDSFSMKILLVN